MFESLTDKLQGVFSRLRGKGRLSEADVDEALREVRMALLEADVSFRVVKQFVARVRELAVGQDVFESLTGAQTVVKLVHDELAALLGGEAAPVRFAAQPPTVWMLCGLQGSGKTTTCGKLALWARRQGRRPMMVACDVYRPAAIRQLQVLGDQLQIPVFALTSGERPVEIARRAMEEARRGGHDVVLLDTAGRLHIDEGMMAELEQLRSAVPPSETLLVVDAMTGQDAVNFAQEFHKRLAVDGFIVAKLDGDARGGAALSIRSVTGVPIKLIGVGEKLDALEPFHPDRMASRILGMGDVLSLIEKAQEALDQKKAVELERRLRENRFDLNDFLDQVQQMRKLGPMEQILGMLPGMGKLKGLQVSEKEIGRIEAMVRSMTREERDDPTILNGSRKRRIAAGSGTTVQEINQFLNQFQAMRQMVKTMFGSEGALRRKKRRMRMPFAMG